MMGDLQNRLIIDDTSTLSPAMLRIRARRNDRRHGHLSVISLDYLQLMQDVRGRKTVRRKSRKFPDR